MHEKYRFLLSPGGTRVWPRLLRFCLVVVLINAPFWILSTHNFVSRGLISLDGLLALLILSYSMPWGLAAIALSWACDFSVSAASVYHFASPLEFFRSIRFAGQIGWTDLLHLKVATMLILPFVLALVGIWRLRLWPVGNRLVVGSIAFLLCADALNGSSAVSQRDVRQVSVNIAGSSLHGIARALLADTGDTAVTRVAPGSGGRAEFENHLPSAMSSGRSVLYVIVESMGWHTHPAVRGWLQQQLYPASVSRDYSLSIASVTADGGTTSGELRRLCGLQGSYRIMTSEVGEHCLPKVFANLGWHTLGYHGFSAEMFDRRRWWPLIGIQDGRFAEELIPNSTRECGGAFRGICDDDLVGAAVRSMAATKTFAYVLTLNSHLPVAPIDFPSDLAIVCKEANVGDDVCTLLAHQGVALRAVAGVLSSTFAKPFVIVVGDHSPPFFDSQSREQFAHHSVPLFALTPSDISPAP